MVAYNKTWLNNLDIHRDLEEAYNYQYISKEEMESAQIQYPVGFYTPNFFVRIGLFVLTTVIVLFSFGFFALLFLDNSSEKVFGVLQVLFSLFCYGALELLIKEKHHYQSGADDALVWITGILAVSGFNLLADISPLGNAILIFCISSLLVLRFKDTLMSAVVVLSLAAILFYSYIKLGSIAKATMPFLLMAFFALVYLFIQNKVYQYYANCILAIKVTTLAGFYLSGNYFIVREGGNELLGMRLADGAGIPFGWLFWTLTVLIPFAYVFRGIQKKDILFLRLGLLLMALTVATVRYYYHLLPFEIALCICGTLLIAIAYSFIRYLQQPRKGFTYQELNEPALMDKLQVEALVITQTFGQPAKESTHTQFGGGSGGGGGATGKY